MTAPAFILHGTSSAGKSSIAKALQRNSSSAVFHIELDAFVCMANRGDMASDAERNVAYKLHCQNLQATLSNVGKSHFELVLDTVLRDDEEFGKCLQALIPRPIYLIGITCPLEVLEERERARGDRGIGTAREQYGHKSYQREYSMIIDTSETSPEEAARAIRALVLP
jgi:chloramphenicol 3-O phosphotransferase